MSDLGHSVTTTSQDHQPCRESADLAASVGTGTAAFGRIITGLVAPRDQPNDTERRQAMPSPADREKALETALAQIDRQFGKGSVMRLGSDERAPVAVIPTGSIALDVALGIGGLPRGRIVEIYGPESSGKTTLTLHAIANAQKAGGIAAFIDAEHALDPEYAKKLGVDIDSLLVSQPDTGEQALEIADMLVRSGSIDLIVIDSVAALVPRAEIEGEMGDAHVGLQARLMSQALRKLTGGLSQTNTTMIFINQLREKIGVFFGSPETTAGGKALKFYASVRLDIRRIETLKDGTDAVGNRTRVKVVKNKMAPPFKQAEFDILYGVGISREGSLIDYGVEHEIVRKSGAWYTYDGDQLGQGKENARNFLIENPATATEIENKILVKLGIGEIGKAAASAAAAAAAAPVAPIAPVSSTAASKRSGAKADEAFPESIDDELMARMASGE
jgi:recombination protein RecA